MILNAGSEVKIYVDNELLNNPNAPMILEEDVTLNLSSNFSPLVGAEANKALTTFSGLAQGLGANFSVTGQFKQLGFQQWTSTQPLGFSFTVTLNMRSNAYYDVYLPALKLMELPLPTDLGLSKQGVGLKAPGPSVATALGKNGKSSTIALITGAIRLNPIIVKKAEPVFSRMTDDDGYPIGCTMRIDVETVYTATTNMIRNFGQRSKNKFPLPKPTL